MVWTHWKGLDQSEVFLTRAPTLCLTEPPRYCVLAEWAEVGLNSLWLGLEESTCCSGRVGTDCHPAQFGLRNSW